MWNFQREAAFCACVLIIVFCFFKVIIRCSNLDSTPISMCTDVCSYVHSYFLLRDEWRILCYMGLIAYDRKRTKLSMRSDCPSFTAENLVLHRIFLLTTHYRFVLLAIIIMSAPMKLKHLKLLLYVHCKSGLGVFQKWLARESPPRIIIFDDS